MGPLHGPDVAALAAQVLGDPAPDALLDLLAARAGGVPLFVRELIVALRESGRLFRSGGRWVLGRGADGLVPPGVAELFAGRTAELAPADRAVLEAVSVAGDAATFDLLDSVCADAAPPERLDGLHAAGLWPRTWWAGSSSTGPSTRCWARRCTRACPGMRGSAAMPLSPRRSGAAPRSTSAGSPTTQQVDSALPMGARAHGRAERPQARARRWQPDSRRPRGAPGRYRDRSGSSAIRPTSRSSAPATC